MGRAPCCEKKGLKKGPWTKEEDRILINYINANNGHGNWRALPKKAGLLRCGKSCRLRWTNYLRPEIKRGNFSKEEEDAIIKLHQALGNRWSAIAATLPGRTDNEIKNIWHTRLKKRVLRQDQHPVTETKQEQGTITLVEKASIDYQDSNSSPLKISEQEQDINNQRSPMHSSCDDICSSSVTSINTTTISDQSTKMFLNPHDPVINNNQESDQDIWNDVVSSQDDSLSPVLHHGSGFKPTALNDIDFWCDLFTRTEETSDLLEF